MEKRSISSPLTMKPVGKKTGRDVLATDGRDDDILSPLDPVTDVVGREFGGFRTVSLASLAVDSRLSAARPELVDRLRQWTPVVGQVRQFLALVAAGTRQGDDMSVDGQIQIAGAGYLDPSFLLWTYPR